MIYLEMQGRGCQVRRIRALEDIESAAVPQTEHKDTGSSDIYYGDEGPRVINKIVYCHKDGTEVATLWEENQNLPILNSEK